MQISKELARKLSSEISMLCSDLAKKHGLTILPRGGRLGETSMVLKFELALVNGKGETQTQRTTDFKKLAKLYGLRPTDLGRKFIVSGVSYQLSGLHAGNSKYPILGLNKQSGKTFKFPAAIVSKALGRNA
jgi:hypothetical protein